MRFHYISMELVFTLALAPALSPRRGRIVRHAFENLYVWIGRALCFPLPAKRGEGQGEGFVFPPNLILLKSGGINFCSPVFFII
jgi:hypothetical protein